MKKVMYIGNIAAPYTVKLAKLLKAKESEYGFQFKFFFYEDVDSSRSSFWKLSLPSNCKILQKVFFKKIRRYLSLELNREYKSFSPDVLILNGLALPSNYLLYRQAKKDGIKICLYSEFLRNKQGKDRTNGIYINLLKYLYKRNFNLVLAIESHGKEYFEKNFNFTNVKAFQYPIDIDSHLNHDRSLSRNTPFTIIFTHRLIESYNPILAIEVVNKLLQKGYDIKMMMNANGNLRSQCENLIIKLNIEPHINFLDSIKRWDDLPIFYEMADISLTTASFSNGCMSIIEAHASGMGVICTPNVKTNVDLINNSKSGIISDMSLNALVKAIEEYIKSPKLNNLHGVNGRKSVKRWSIKSTAEKLITELQKIT